MTADAPAPLRAAFAVGLVAGCTLALQVLLTRVFSAVLFYHFGFLAISLALLGRRGGRASSSTSGRSWFERGRSRRCSRAGRAVAGAARWRWCRSPRAARLLDASGRDQRRLRAQPRRSPACWRRSRSSRPASRSRWRCAATRARSAASTPSTWRARRSARVGVVPLMWIVDAPTLLVALGARGGARRAPVRAGRRARAPLGGAAARRALAAVVLAATTALYALPPHTPRPRARAGRDRWTPLSRVLGYPPPGERRDRAAWSTTASSRRCRSAGPGEPLPDWRTLQHGPQSVGYELTGPGRRAGDRRRRRARHRERAHLGPAARGRDRAEPRDPRRRRRGPRALVRRARTRCRA